VGGALQVVNQNRPSNPNLVAEETGGRQLGIEAAMSTNLLAGMGLPGNNERPGGFGMPIRRVAEQRTLC